MLDYFKPGKFEQGKAAPYGGVCGPQQAGAIVVPPQPFAAGPAVPGPAGIPTLGNANPPSTPLPPPDFGVPPSGRYIRGRTGQTGTVCVSLLPLEVSRGSDGELVINNGVTRATRIAKLLPGVSVRVDVIDDLPIPVGSFPSIGDMIP